jgi:cytochrome c-type biogenesis protein CcmH
MKLATQKLRRAICGGLFLLLQLGSPARAVDPGEILSDPALEQRARALSSELRCLVCQNQSIDDSNAPLAKDLRVLVREQIQSGKTDTAVMEYIVARYGDFVLLKPPVKLHTLLLWLAPLLCLAGLSFVLLRASGRLGAAPSGQTAAPLSADEEKRLATLLKAVPDQR